MRVLDQTGTDSQLHNQLSMIHKVHERTMKWITGDANQQLMARACGLVFLINKLAGSNNEVGIRADIDTLADLLVEDLAAGSGPLRARLPAVLEKCELLMRVGD